jgi:1,4-dihydroxy-2-naphthoate octaprenyltransferase
MSDISSVYWFDKSTVKHLRFPFSYHLMPVFLFALSQTADINWKNTAVAFIILHFFIYPASNGYNSYQDRDETSIGGIKHPPKVTENLFYATLLLDITGVLTALYVSVYFSLFVLIYVLVSRAYSFRNLRLKKYALVGFLTVMVFQGGFSYLMVFSATKADFTWTMLNQSSVLCMLVASFFIGSVYPLTQIYQHRSDRADGVTTISYKLGYTGTFVFSSLLFFCALIVLCFHFMLIEKQVYFLLFLLLMLPVVGRLLYWFINVRKDVSKADFDNTMTMNLLASSCMNVYFIILTVNNHYNWF